MALHTLSKGIELPLGGKPEGSIIQGPTIKTIAILGRDYPGLKPTMEVEPGQIVKKGQLLFTDKKLPEVGYTAPGAGKVKAIHRGAKRSFLSLVIELEGDEEVSFPSHSSSELSKLKPAQIKEQLIQSGLWTAIRSRPFSKVADPGQKPHSVFITAMDTNPLAADPELWIHENMEAFRDGMNILAALVEDVPIYLCRAAGSKIESGSAKNIQVEEFKGPHPAGNVSVHIHHIDTVGLNKKIWYLGYQDVIAIGKLFTNGKLFTDRMVAVGGIGVSRPAIVKTRIGASLSELLQGNLNEGDFRYISGSVFGGARAVGEVGGYLGRYHNQVSMISEGRSRDFLGWAMPGTNKYSVLNIFASKIFGKKVLPLDTSTNGSPRAMVPIGTYEKVMPMDLIPTLLLRSLIMNDTDRAVALGALELDEEDVSLFTFACPGKYNYGPILRRNLEIIEKEG